MNPFDALRLPTAPGLSDDQVRQSWRAIAARTHPDRDDGGNPAAYTAAATAYAQLRTPWGRSEALADLAAGPPVPPAPAPSPGRWGALAGPAAVLPARIRHGRPGRILARAVAAAAVAVLAAVVIPGTASVPAVAAGCLLWLGILVVESSDLRETIKP